MSNLEQGRERRAEVSRRTAETEITIKLNLDGSGSYSVKTGIGFFDHMLEQLARHGGFDLEVQAKGDLHVDGHHLVEDTGIVLGQALLQALGDKAGIERYGAAQIPMDETLARVVADLSGRPYMVLRAAFPTERVGDFDLQLVREFFRAFTDNGKFNLHLLIEYGENSHHMVEALFKGAARALRQAVARAGKGGVPSTKGVL